MRQIYFLILALVCQTASCASSQETVSDQQKPPQETNNRAAETKVNDSELERNRRLWQENNITNYRMTVELSSGGVYMIASPVIIEVRKSEKISIKPLRKNSGTTERYEPYDTVEKMFETIGKARYEKAEKIDVEYDSGRGYPKRINIDPSSSAEDDGFNIYITKFEVVQ